MKPKFLTCIFLMIGTLSYAQETTSLSAADEQLLDSVGHAYLKTNQVPGMGIGVLKNGKILYSKGLGVKDQNTKEPVTNKTVFHMASVSKPFVSTAILQLDSPSWAEHISPMPPTPRGPTIS